MRTIRSFIFCGLRSLKRSSRCSRMESISAQMRLRTAITGSRYLTMTVHWQCSAVIISMLCCAVCCAGSAAIDHTLPVSIRLHPSPSVSIRLHPSPSVSIRLHPSPSVSIRLHPSPSVSIRLLCSDALLAAANTAHSVTCPQCTIHHDTPWYTMIHCICYTHQAISSLFNVCHCAVSQRVFQASGWRKMSKDCEVVLVGSWHRLTILTPTRNKQNIV